MSIHRLMQNAAAGGGGLPETETNAVAYGTNSQTTNVLDIETGTVLESGGGLSNAGNDPRGLTSNAYGTAATFYDDQGDDQQYVAEGNMNLTLTGQNLEVNVESPGICKISNDGLHIVYRDQNLIKHKSRASTSDVFVLADSFAVGSQIFAFQGWFQCSNDCFTSYGNGSEAILVNYSGSITGSVSHSGYVPTGAIITEELADGFRYMVSAFRYADFPAKLSCSKINADLSLSDTVTFTYPSGYERPQLGDLNFYYYPGHDFVWVAVGDPTGNLDVSRFSLPDLTRVANQEISDVEVGFNDYAVVSVYNGNIYIADIDGATMYSAPADLSEAFTSAYSLTNIKTSSTCITKTKNF